MTTPLTIETWGLVALSIQALLHVSVQGLVLKAKVGNAWKVGARDNPVDPGVIAARAKRATENFIETAIGCIAVALVIILTERSNSFTEIGCIVYIACRFFYLPAYLTGIPWVRTLLWNAATAGLAAMILGVFL